MGNTYHISTGECRISEPSTVSSRVWLAFVHQKGPGCPVTSGHLPPSQMENPGSQPNLKLRKDVSLRLAQLTGGSWMASFLPAIYIWIFFLKTPVIQSLPDFPGLSWFLLLKMWGGVWPCRKSCVLSLPLPKLYGVFTATGKTTKHIDHTFRPGSFK